MSGLEPLTCSLRVISQALQACAVGCKTLIPRPVSFLCLALRCTVLRSRWCQSGCQERATSDVPPVCSPPLSGTSPNLARLVRQLHAVGLRQQVGGPAQVDDVWRPSYRMRLAGRAR
jgi:hypothetical protein